jgi:hypothetical protein
MLGILLFISPTLKKENENKTGSGTKTRQGFCPSSSSAFILFELVIFISMQRIYFVNAYKQHIKITSIFLYEYEQYIT